MIKLYFLNPSGNRAVLKLLFPEFSNPFGYSVIRFCLYDLVWAGYFDLSVPSIKLYALITFSPEP
ncbi:hypothetical protein [Mycoplasmopsis cynos]|uniref:Uncharacterized protein n=1 Tax=Mycoplasmopsis cynos (strain C142) TaxID=1246955 RepID=L0RUA0_MYCC1|nr:hypothetical protein [Mycoplasmopsis cynos]UWV77139.1 hypothetical protein NW070_05255 [Mycoplasmopsis cynos]WAM08208.1 hypothetical protein ONA21_02820 [Mycoplasmopsis cynos]CCP23883.1 Hypothetical protein MCYN_0151 [Mycoplasmopsis cynos C142]